ncbi:MAG TPA: DinB family protein [Candidatus Kapabacteria bacterium]|nr:DinB family protein [Candidatus Kapabacteria bacterium]
MTAREHLIELFRYNGWANDLLFSAIPHHVLDVETTSSFNSLRKTVYHQWSAEWIWHERVLGNSPSGFNPNEFAGTFEEALRLMLEQNAEWMTEVEDRTDEELVEPITYKNFAGKQFTRRFDEIVMHVCNHSTFHRGQVVTMLRANGVTTIPATDLSLYFNLRT